MSIIKKFLFLSHSSRIWPREIDFHWNFYLFTLSMLVGVYKLEDSAMHCLGHMESNKETKVLYLLCPLNPNSLANLSSCFQFSEFSLLVCCYFLGFLVVGIEGNDHPH